jgi:hypothetical protein
VGFARDQPDPGFLWPVGSVGACRCLRRRSAGLDERVREAQRNGLPYVCSRMRDASRGAASMRAHHSSHTDALANLGVYIRRRPTEMERPDDSNVER